MSIIHKGIVIASGIDEDLFQKKLIEGKNIKIDNNNIISASDETDPIYTADKPNLAFKTDIPTKLPNPKKLIINGTGYDGTDEVTIDISNGGIEEAPEDGKEYVRKNADWVENTGGSGGITEAPEDGKLYGRKNADWEEIANGTSNVNDVTVNGVSVVGEDKVAKITLKTKLSEFTNDTTFIDETTYNSDLESIGQSLSNLSDNKSDKDLGNIENKDFFNKGIASGLGQATIPEIQPTLSLYVIGEDADNNITLNKSKPLADVSIPITITTNGTVKNFKYEYEENGVISALSTFSMVLQMSSMETKVDYQFSVMQTANISGVDYLIGGDLYENRYSIDNPRVEIPLENNVLTANLNRKSGDYMSITIVFTKSSGNADTAFITSTQLQPSKLVRNGGDIGTTNVIDFDGIDTQTQSFRNRKYENELEKKVEDVKINDISVVTNKIANIDLSKIKLSEFENDSEFIDKNVDNLTNYYTKSETDNLSDELQDNIDTVDAIARGKSRAEVFNNIQELDNWLLNPLNTEKLEIGDNFYIVELDVPDFWWDGKTKQPLESEKVDLTQIEKGLAITQTKYIARYDGGTANTYTVMNIPSDFDFNKYKLLLIEFSVYNHNAGTKLIVNQDTFDMIYINEPIPALTISGGEKFYCLFDYANKKVELMFKDLEKRNEQDIVNKISTGYCTPETINKYVTTAIQEAITDVLEASYGNIE